VTQDRSALVEAARSTVRHIRKLKRRLLAPHFRRKNTGRGCLIDRQAQVLGWKSIRLGDYVIVSEGCWLNINGPDRPEPQLEIGHHTHLGRRSTVSPGRKIVIGDYVLTGSDCNIIGSHHVYDDPFKPYGSTGNTLDGTLRIGTNCWLGAQVSIIGAITIGHGSIIGSGTVITKDVPPFSIVVGNPARVIKRFDMRAKSWRDCADIPQDNDALLPDEERYRATLRANVPHFAMPYLAAGVSQGNLA
jgi:acetyltransferase-like isoleucine patch superfamily enzyme